MGSKLFTPVLQTFDRRLFDNNVPCPWAGFDGLLTESAFSTLVEEFPALKFFERHEKIPRCHDQRPHDRYYLALNESVYGSRRDEDSGVIQIHELSPTWRAFIEALQSDTYLSFASKLLGHRSDVQLRFAWHVAGNGADVSPHIDSEKKIGTHIFYFNTSDDWSPDWGGRTTFLGGKRNETLNPEFSDFETTNAAELLDNHSTLFKNTPNAWHGAEPISCPKDRFRRIFNVIFENATAPSIPSQFQSIVGRFVRQMIPMRSTSSR